MGVSLQLQLLFSLSASREFGYCSSGEGLTRASIVLFTLFSLCSNTSCVERSCI
uniref:Uncharacterized protein MANES_04G083600 n=1 Tax=Rhizophora mucronata TaxID=61149 RepID=A0A2P2QFM7_RHIMU